MMNRPIYSRAAAIAAVVGAVTLAACSGAPAGGGATNANAAQPSLPDWRGVWAHVGSRNMDPTTESGAPQPNAPLNVVYKARYEANLAAKRAGKPVGDIGCLPEGPPRNMRAPYPLEVIATPDQTWILLEFKQEIRRIYTDGRKAPEDVDHTYAGFSTGHWEGDTLVFDTVGLKAGTLDSGGLEHSDELTLHERMRRISPDILEDEITMTDPQVFTRPWTVTRQFKLEKDWKMAEFVCEENERNPVGKDGQTGIVLKSGAK